MMTTAIVLALVILSILVYQFWSPLFGSKPKREVPVGEAKLYFFYTDWCGWSKKAMPHWEDLEQQLADSSRFGKSIVKLVRVNAEEDRKTAMLYDVEAYPTILLETPTQLIPYTKIPTTEGLLAFLSQSLGQKA
jgi:thiol-disulfide isomerase/thioredoxin